MRLRLGLRVTVRLINNIYVKIVSSGFAAWTTTDSQYKGFVMTSLPTTTRHLFHASDSGNISSNERAELEFLESC